MVEKGTKTQTPADSSQSRSDERHEDDRRPGAGPLGRGRRPSKLFSLVLSLKCALESQSMSWRFRADGPRISTIVARFAMTGR